MTKSKNLEIPNNLSWDLLRKFNICAKSKTFAEACIKLDIGQSALTKQIDLLEQAMNTNLFIRVAKNRSKKLTESGYMLLAICNNIENLIENNTLPIIKKQQAQFENIKLITTHGLATSILPNLISEFLNSNEHISVDLNISLIPPKINVGEILIRHDFTPQNNLKAVAMKKIEASFYATQKYLDIHGYPTSLEELSQHHLLSTQYFNITSLDKFAYNQDNYYFIAPRIKSEFFSFLIEMVIRGHGIMEIPNFHPATKNLIKIPNLKIEPAETYAIFLDIAEQNQSVYKFINHCKHKKII